MKFPESPEEAEAYIGKKGTPGSAKRYQEYLDSLHREMKEKWKDADPNVRKAMEDAIDANAQADAAEINSYRAADPTENTGYQYRGRAGAADEDINRYRGMGEAADRRAAIQADYSQANDTRGNQLEALGMYRDAALGNGPSAAQSQFQRGLDQSLAAGQSIANSARGGALGMAQARLAAAQQGGQMLSGATAQAAALRAQEQQAAMAGYAGLGTQTRGQDLNAAQVQAQLALGSRAQNDARQMGFEGLGQGVAQMQQTGDLSREAAITGNAVRQTEAERQRAAAAQAAADRRDQAMAGAVLSAIPYVGGAASSAYDASSTSTATPTTQTAVDYNGSNAGQVAYAGASKGATPPVQTQTPQRHMSDAPAGFGTDTASAPAQQASTDPNDSRGKRRLGYYGAP